MSRLKAIYTHMQDEYVRKLSGLEKYDFLAELSEMTIFSGVKLETRQIHAIFREICSPVSFHRLFISNLDGIYPALWKNVLTADEYSLLDPNSDRSAIIARWIERDWDEKVLEIIARHSEWKQCPEPWSRKAGKESISISKSKNEIAHEQWYRLTSDRQEKYDILRSAWKFHFSQPLPSEPLPGQGDRIRQILNEHVTHFPDDAPRLRETFHELVAGSKDGRERRAGWMGLATIGAGTYEDELLELLRLRLKRLNRSKKEKAQNVSISMVNEVAEEIEGMTQWIPASETHRRTLLQTWASMLSQPCPSDIAFHTWNREIHAALWRARFRMETSEEQLWEEITKIVNHGFLPPAENSSEEPLSLEVMQTLVSWQPQSPEIRQRWREFLESCLICSFSAERGFRQRNPDVFWKGLLNVDPQHPRLGENLLEWLSNNKYLENDWHSPEVIITWLQKDGLPETISPEVRQQLEGKVWQVLTQTFDGNNKLLYHRMSTLAFYIMAFTPPDPEEKNWKEREKISSTLLENIEILSEVTRWLEHEAPPSVRAWQPVVQQHWEKKLAAISPATPPWEVKTTLEYFAGTMRRHSHPQPDSQPDSRPTHVLTEKLLLLIKEGEDPDLVSMAARLGGQLATRMDSNFSRSWAHAVKVREMEEFRKGYGSSRRLSKRLNLIRQEFVMRQLSGYLANLSGEKPAKGTTAATDRNVAGKIWLRKLVHHFPDIAGENPTAPSWEQPPGIWPGESMFLITGKSKKSGKETSGKQKMPYDFSLPLPEVSSKQSPVFHDPLPLAASRQPTAGGGTVISADAQCPVGKEDSNPELHRHPPESIQWR